MKILSVSPLNAVQSHVIPLFVLNQRYFNRMDGIKNIMITQKNYHKEFINKGLNVLPIDFSFYSRNEINTNNVYSQNMEEYKEMISLAFEMAKPDIVLDAHEPLASYIAEKHDAPRISIQRTGIFRSINKKLQNPRHVHSMEKLNNGKILNSSLILRPNSKLSRLIFEQLKHSNPKEDNKMLHNYINPKSKIIPGIPSIEKLPEQIDNKNSYFYSGPLLVEDFFDKTLYQEIDNFLDYNKNRKKVFITTGLCEMDSIDKMLKHLLMKGYAVISTNEIELTSEYQNRFFHKSFLPLNKVCSECDLIIHHCGSGIYHYPLLHKKASLTFGTQCYDREDVALRLQQLNVSKHIPSPRDNDNYFEIFCEYIEMYENERVNNYSELKLLEKEIYDTMLSFDMKEVVDYTLS